MNNLASYVLVLVIGIIAGIVFFGGLWLTIRFGMKSKYPSILFAFSLFFRLAAVMAAFYYVAVNYQNQPAIYILLCLAGLLAARSVFTGKISGRPGFRN